MPHCPHCGKSVDHEPTAVIPSCRYDPSSTKVSVGCGTLILIAIIVAVFSGAGDNSDQIRQLQRDIQSLEQKIDAMAEQ